MNIERRGDRLYEGDGLHKWFAISSLLLFLFTVLMVFIDYSREWKTYQRAFTRLQLQKTQQDIQAAAGSFDRTQFNQLSQQLAQARANMQQHEADVKTGQSKIDDIKAKYYRINQNYQFKKAEYDSVKYEYDEAVAHKASNVDKLKAKLDGYGKEMNDYRSEADQLSLDQKAAEAELSKYTGARDAAQKGIDTLATDYNRLLVRK